MLFKELLFSFYRCPLKHLSADWELSNHDFDKYHISRTRTRRKKLRVTITVGDTLSLSNSERELTPGETAAQRSKPQRKRLRFNSNNMCTQAWIHYTCGCKFKGQFHQCDALYDAQSPLQCAQTTLKKVESRNYCPEHLPRADKATMTYTRREPVA